VFGVETGGEYFQSRYVRKPVKTTKLLYRTPGLLVLLVTVLIFLTNDGLGAFLGIVRNFLLIWSALGIYLKYGEGVEI
jgi:hypothetical protein